MSQWRQKGFVLDSDEEDEDLEISPPHSAQESQNASTERVAHVQPTAESGIDEDGKEGKEEGKRDDCKAEGGLQEEGNNGNEQESSHTPRQPSTPIRPAASPMMLFSDVATPTPPFQSRIEISRLPNESPDPIQTSPSRRVLPQDNSLASSQNVRGRLSSQTAVVQSVRKNNFVPAGSGRLAAFGLEDFSSDDDLSDPPTDLEGSPSRPVFASPIRRTAVKAVIPMSNPVVDLVQRVEERPRASDSVQEQPADFASVEEIEAQGQRYQRSFRKRRPIQLHPYVLEGERYRQELQRRGIRPVARVRSPVRNTARDDAETQDREFEPDQDSISMGSFEIPVSTPVVRNRPSPLTRRSRSTQKQPRSTTDTGAKRRKVNHIQPSSEAVVTHQSSNRDVWTIPPSPPNSSSPPPPHTGSVLRRIINPILTSPAIDIPTPSLSSSIRGDALVEDESDQEPIRSIHRSTQRPRPVVTITSDDSSLEAEQSHDSEPSDTEIKRVSKRIKGVLPASWLRLNPAQDKVKTQARVPFSDARSPEKAGPQRGVAQRVIRKGANIHRTASTLDRSQEATVISDDSDSDVDLAVYRATNVQQPAQSASDIAAILDRQYGDVDSEDMDDDRLDLFPLGGGTRKRKTQTKVTDPFAKLKKPKLNTGCAKPLRTSHKIRHSTSRRAKRTPPPALSILDFDISPSSPTRNVPDFIRAAQRRARKRPDLARQRPMNKHIRLHTAGDTEDALTTLQRWRTGVIKPRENVRQAFNRTNHRDPLASINDNQQSSPIQPNINETPDLGNEAQKPSAPVQTQATRERQKIRSGLVVFQQSIRALRRNGPSSSEQPSRKRQPVQRKPVSYRTAQLEGLETNFSTDRRFEFAKGLQQVNQQYRFQLPTTQPARNLQLSRFLADEDAIQLPPTSVRETEEQGQNPSKVQPPGPRRRLIRKRQAQRIDADAREYRQPSEPALDNYFVDSLAEADNVSIDQGPNEPILKGLGPYGTRYPTFDSLPLKSDTYFHISTFVGGGELSRALPKTEKEARNLDDHTGYVVISHESKIVKCGPWDDGTFAQLSDLITTLWLPLDDQALSQSERTKIQESALQATAKLLRSIINYVATRLSFLDPIDRRSFAEKMKQLAELLFNKMLSADTSNVDHITTPTQQPSTVRPMTYLLVLAMQVRQIAHHSVVGRSLANEWTDLMQSIAKLVIGQLLRHISHFSDFLEKNKRFAERENGIQDSDCMVESLVVSMQVLNAVNMQRCSFWDLVAQELVPQAEKATHVKKFESLWANLFTLLPFVEVDNCGIMNINGRMTLRNDSWMLIKALLKRLFTLYPRTYRVQSFSLNDYVRATLTRCHVLIHYWHWQKCDPALSEIFDFFGKNGLRMLQKEKATGSTQFLEELAGQPSLNLDSNDKSFQIFLKCLALGLQGIRKLPHLYPEKKIRSMVLRLTPNHGRSHPKDQNLDTESLDALRNHHELLCTLYWASPPSCRPKLELIRDLVHHENSHREACKLNVRAWANLATFQLSSGESPETTRPFAEWHKEMMLQTLKQYRLAKTEAEDYLKSGVLDTDAVSSMVRQTIERNQEQVIATLRDCIAGMRRAVERSMDKTISKIANQDTVRDFLAASGLVQLLELLHFKDPRLVVVIRDTLGVFRSYAKLMTKVSNQKISQPTSEESQDYGDSLDLDDLAQLEGQCLDQRSDQPTLAFIEDPLWRLLSNAFGAELAPDDNLLMECIDTWALISGCQVSMGARSWSYYLNSFSQVSWQQLRRTEQTQKFGPYFMAALLSSDPAAYIGHEADFITTLLCCLADRESMLRFQHRLLQAIISVDPNSPLMQNLPFFPNDSTGELDINSETLRSRRILLISSLLANMRDDFHATISENPQRVIEVRSEYAMMLKTFMSAMKSNYQQLGQGSAVAGTYVEFVQKIIQLLQQYTADITPVLEFFTSSVTFPLPATDPTYVVGRLCGYAPKLSRAGVPKQLSVFIQTVAQQAAVGSEQVYLVDQLKTALCTNEAPARDRIALRDALLQGIFPAYIEAAFASRIGLAIALPILRSLPSILDAIMVDVRVFDEASVRQTYDMIMSIAHAFVRNTEELKDNVSFFEQPHIIGVIGSLFDSMTPVLGLLEYICSRYLNSAAKPNIVTYFEQLAFFIAEMFHGITPQVIPWYVGDAYVSPCKYTGLLPFSQDGLKESMQTNWSLRGDSVFFGHGNAQRKVQVDVESIEEESTRLMKGSAAFYAAVQRVYGSDNRDERVFYDRRALGYVHV